jgi:hypothetical protein
VALVGENELFRAEIGIDESLELFTLFLVFLQSRPRDLCEKIVRVMSV